MSQDPLRANLAHYRLPLVVPALFDQRLLTASLRLCRGALQRTFWFRDGELVSTASNAPREHLAQVLSDLNILDLPRSAAAFSAAHEGGVKLGTFLVERGFVDRARMIEALSHKARESFFDCYAWESGELELTWDAPPPDLGIELQLALGSLHRDGLARLREWRAFRSVFPNPDTTFRVHRHVGRDWRSEQEELLLDLAERGASLGELLASGREGSSFASRRILQLYRRGVLSPRSPQGPAVGDVPDVAHLVELTRSLLDRGQYEAATAVAAQALETAPVPEASALYREAELRLGLALSDEVLSLEGRLSFLPLPRPLPPQLTADDVYLHGLLRAARSLREAVTRAAMGELAAYRSIRRLVEAGYIRIQGGAPQRKTLPYGIPVPRF